MTTQPRRFLDVWIIETNTVYREVPFNVVTDWLQQGRLLADDQLRPSGTAQWFRIGDNPSYAAYLPQVEPFRAEDQAEALEPVEMDLHWRHRPSDDDDDVDMIPLIDVSLVLLVFFIMTTTGVTLAANIKTPDAVYGYLRDTRGDQANPAMLWIGITQDGNGDPIYSLGEGESAPSSPDDQGLITLKQLTDRLDQKLQERDRPSEVLIRAQEDVPSGIVRKVQIELERRSLRIQRKFQSVSHKEVRE
jgi:biopolymer transport protein ExbD